MHGKRGRQFVLGDAREINTGWYDDDEEEEIKDFSQSKRELREVIANRIKELRQANRFTQEEFSEMIDCNFKTYKGYENLHSDVPLVYLIRIADRYHVSLDYLTGRTNSMEGMYTFDESEPLSEEDETQLEMERYLEKHEFETRIAEIEAQIKELKNKA